MYDENDVNIQVRMLRLEQVIKSATTAGDVELAQRLQGRLNYLKEFYKDKLQ